jgi:ribulose 1,5-bisphosphate synthetase/thiazole synthase
MIAADGFHQNPESSATTATTEMGTMVDGAAAKIIIIGAGFAGLAAARRVASRGAGRWQATVLEGSHRVGGRAHTVEVLGPHVPMSRSKAPCWRALLLTWLNLTAAAGLRQC